MTDARSQGVKVLIGNAASPEVFTEIADVMDVGNLELVRAAIANTKLSSTGPATSLPGRVTIPDWSFSGSYDANNAQTASLWTKLTTLAQANTNFKLDLVNHSPAEVWSFAAYVGGFALTNLSDDNVQSFNCTLRLQTIPTQAAT